MKYLIKNENKKSYVIKAIVAGSIISSLILNAAPTFAATSNKTPASGTQLQLVTSKEYEAEGKNYTYSIESAEIQGLKNKQLESINRKYKAQAQQLYGGLMKTIEQENLNGNKLENLTFTSKYSVKANNGTTMSIENSVYRALGSGYQMYEYDTIDIKNEKYITLPSLFKDASYVDVISKEIEKQMTAQMTADKSKSYYTYTYVGNDGSEKEVVEPVPISGHEQFYINDNNKLVIVFSQGEVAPEFMGSVEFIIPTDVIKNILVGNDYVK